MLYTAFCVFFSFALPDGMICLDKMQDKAAYLGTHETNKRIAIPTLLEIPQHELGYSVGNLKKVQFQISC